MWCLVPQRIQKILITFPDETVLKELTKQNKITVSTIKTCEGSPVQRVKCLFAALHITLERFLFCVNTDMDLETVRGEEGLPAALLIAHKGVLAPVCLLMRPQISCCAVSPWATFKCALVPLYLKEDKNGTTLVKLS